MAKFYRKKKWVITAGLQNVLKFFQISFEPIFSPITDIKIFVAFLFILKMISKICLKVVTSEKIGWSEVASTLGTWYGGVVMGVLLSFDEAAIL